jgi:hypothetical protein
MLPNAAMTAMNERERMWERYGQWIVLVPSGST